MKNIIQIFNVYLNFVINCSVLKLETPVSTNNTMLHIPYIHIFIIPPFIGQGGGRGILKHKLTNITL